MKKGESILIHSGTGGIGQAAINLCLNMGCTIFTTVGTEEKREFMKKNFPQVNGLIRFKLNLNRNYLDSVICLQKSI